jgi:hypothetical protein
VAFIAFIIGIAFLVAEFFFLVQLTEAIINSIGGGHGVFFNTGNFWAWIAAIVLMCVAVFVVRFVFKFVNGFAALTLGCIFAQGFERKERNVLGATQFASVLIWITWIIASFPMAGAVLEHFAAHPELNGWLAEGGLLATVLTYFGVLGLVFPLNKND